MTSLRAVRLGKHAFTLAGIEPIEIGRAWFISLPSSQCILKNLGKKYNGLI